MIENVMQSIGGVGIFGVISICLFFAFFTGMLWWARGLKKGYLNTMQALPLEQDWAQAGNTSSLQDLQAGDKNGLLSPPLSSSEPDWPSGGEGLDAGDR